MVEPTPCGAADLPAFIRWARSRRKLADTSIRSYLVWIRDAEQYHHHRGGCLLTAAQASLESYLETIPQTAASRNCAIAALKAWYAFLGRHGTLANDPSKDIRMWRNQELPAKPVDKDLVGAFLEECFADSMMLGTMAISFLGTGLRLEELRTRRWASLVGHRLFVKRKGGGEKVVALPKEVRDALADWRRCAPEESEWMFASPRYSDRPVSAGWVYTHIKEAGEAVGIENMHPHRLRHTGITEFYRTTKDALRTQRFAGHSKFHMTRRYIEIVDLESDPAVENLRFRTSGGTP